MPLPSLPGTIYLSAHQSILSSISDEIQDQLSELRKLREAAERKKERDRVGSKRCGKLHFFLSKPNPNSNSMQLHISMAVINFWSPRNFPFSIVKVMTSCW